MDPRRLGEFGLIEAIRRRAGSRAGAWTRTIGDDAALLRPRPGCEIAVTVDALVEDVHFRWSTTPPRALGRKALAVSLSDLAAMGARPLGFLLVLALPRDAAPARVDAVLGGMLALARSAGCPLVGGDTVSGPCWTLSTTAFGEVPRGRALLRSGARPGHRVLVAGELGAAALGLRLLESGRAGRPAARPFVRRQLDPVPLLDAGMRLRRGRLASAAIDVSDGLVQDLGHVLDESRVGAEVHVEQLPLARGLARLAREEGLDPVTLALAGGEDYALVFCAPARGPAAGALARRLGCRVTEIGRIRRGRSLRLLRAGRALSLPGGGWDHFKAAPL
jgi:thiamine-monophosphate kinase